MSFNQNQDIKNESQNANDVILIIKLIFNKKITISIITLISAFSSLAFAISLPNIYKSEALLAPTNQEESLSSRLGEFSAFSGFAGLNIGSSKDKKSTEAIERIQSFHFFSEQVLPYIKLEDLIAVKAWNPQDDEVVYKKNIFDKSSNIWVRDVSYPQQKIPSAQEAYKAYLDILTVNLDKNTSFVTIAIEHQSPKLAQEWVSIIVRQINQVMREIDSQLAKKYIAYLSEAEDIVKIKSVQNSISRLLESQMNILMMSNSNDSYIFTLIDSPLIAENKLRPSRLIICLIGTLLGIMLSLIFIAIQNFKQFYKNN